MIRSTAPSMVAPFANRIVAAPMPCAPHGTLGSMSPAFTRSVSSRTPPTVLSALRRPALYAGEGNLTDLANRFVRASNPREDTVEAFVMTMRQVLQRSGIADAEKKLSLMADDLRVAWQEFGIDKKIAAIYAREFNVSTLNALVQYMEKSGGLIARKLTRCALKATALTPQQPPVSSAPALAQARQLLTAMNGLQNMPESAQRALIGWVAADLTAQNLQEANTFYSTAAGRDVATKQMRVYAMAQQAVQTPAFSQRMQAIVTKRIGPR